MPVETLITSSCGVAMRSPVPDMAHDPAIGSRTGTTASPPVCIPLYMRPNGHPLGSVLRQKQNGSENRLAHYGGNASCLVSGLNDSQVECDHSGRVVNP